MDPALQAFEVESFELLEELEKNLLILETPPFDPEVINSIFRAVHTIKGSSGVVDLIDVQSFTHMMENVLARLRDGELKVDTELVELLLESRDHVANLVDLAVKGVGADSYLKSVEQGLNLRMAAYLGEDFEAVATEAPEEAPEEIVVTERSVESENWHLSIRFGPAVFRNGMDPLSFIHYLGEVGEIVSIATLLESMPPLKMMVHDTCYLGFEIDLRSRATKREIEDVFEFVADDCDLRIIPPRAVIDDYVALINELPEGTDMLGEILVSGGALTPLELVQALRRQVPSPGEERKPLGSILLDEGYVEHEVLDAALEKQRTVKDRGPVGVSRTIRVETGKLDALMNIVGEMVIAQANIIQSASELNDRQMSSTAAVMSRLIQDMREKVNEVRMVPISTVLERYHRTVRDVCTSDRKEIELVISGGETEIDRNIAERLNDPLLHLVRNAADHGIEAPEDRLSKGKPRKGSITIEASQDAGQIVIRVSDDGRGIDSSKVAEKARKMGIIGGQEALGEGETLGLIFHAGLSTRDAASSLSGRGVGMDVVKQNIEAMRGKIELSSEPGRGTVLTMRLPLTLAIIEGFMVRSGTQMFAIPLDVITECLELNGDTRAFSEGRRLFRLRERLVPFVRIREFFGLKGDGDGDEEYEYIVVVRDGEREIGLAVDELFGERQIVIKSLGRVYESIKAISGAAIMGDGSVAMIIDVPQVVREASDMEEASGRALTEEDGGIVDEDTRS